MQIQVLITSAVVLAASVLGLAAGQWRRESKIPKGAAITSSESTPPTSGECDEPIEIGRLFFLEKPESLFVCATDDTGKVMWEPVREVREPIVTGNGIFYPSNEPLGQQLDRLSEYKLLAFGMGALCGLNVHYETETGTIVCEAYKRRSKK